MITKENYVLSNGVKIPKIGLGTWFIDNETVVDSIKSAIEFGYRHIDTAQAYQNENGIGKGIAASAIAREDLFITTKLAAEVKSYDEAIKSIEDSLKELNLDYIDLMLIHSPRPWMEFFVEDPYFEGNLEAWRALEDLYKAGKLKSIGVSNFQKKDLENIMDSCSIQPMVNQILAHIAQMPNDLIEFCKTNEILVEAYSPIGHGELMKKEEVQHIAHQYGVSSAQLSIKYVLQKGLLPLPKTANPEHLKTNIELDFNISDTDMNYLDKVKALENYGEASIFPVFGGDLRNLK